MLLPSRAVCTAALCLRSCALQGSALAFEERAVSTKKIARIVFYMEKLALNGLNKPSVIIMTNLESQVSKHKREALLLQTSGS